ncbi:transcriptional regulator, TetR family [Goodfellowiella coeruleoviolacea]|uniref:Transcriptional regulator, TetR family n=1 Tax=Goodfellowiella coeruleoviolacea TaxID=334858 RepID=A0AAE3GDF9_9PSEU|nr:transcriptional regulator, TetR family [Goodfellowiella coeruleoviolacea]
MNRVDERGEPPYLRIAGEIRRRISDGELRPGDRVPSARRITQEWGVAIATATKVLATLRQEGLVRAVSGVGTVVADPACHRAPAARRQPRAPEGELSRDRIVHAALGLADAEGLAALSMRRVATELGAATMSLYRHVSGKDELVLLLADTAFGEARLPEHRPAGWRAQLELAARLEWELYQRHPWLAQVISVGKPQLLPNMMLHGEWLVRALTGVGLDAATITYAYITVFNYVRGVAVNLATQTESERDTGMRDAEWMEANGDAVLSAMASAGTVPSLVGLFTRNEVDYNLDGLFEFGLGRLLDGIAALIGTPGPDAAG